MQQQLLDFDGTGPVSDSAETRLDTKQNGPDLSALHRDTEEILKNRYGDRYTEHLASAMARYLDWVSFRMQQRKDARGKAIARAAARRRRSGNDVQNDDGVVDVPQDE